ncbi:MAG: hypothetical protein AAFX87_01995 [Bacteroidota bacterium]
MKRTHIILILLTALFSNACHTEKQASEDNNPSAAAGLYFGQKPPGLTPEKLIPASFSTEGWKLESGFAPDMNEFYITTSQDAPFNPSVIVFRKEDKVWKQYSFHSADRNVLYAKDKYIERTDSGWSKIKSLGSPFDDIRIMRLTASLNGTLVFDEATRDGSGILRYSRLVNGKREAPKPLSKEINTGRWTAHPFIAPDESYMIWDSEREGGYGDSDMYISFRQEDGSWGAAINFGDEINTDGEDGGGYVTPDGKYLSYCPRCQPPYDRMWVDAQIIEELRAKQ